MKKSILYRFVIMLALSPCAVFPQTNTWFEANGAFSYAVGGMGIDSAGRIFVGSTLKIIRSSDNGVGWESLTNGFSANFVTSVLCTPGKIVLAGTDFGVLRSSDGGNSWGTWYLGTRLPVSSFVLLQNGTIYAANRAGVYRSVDSGAAWVSTGSGLLRYNTHSMVVNASGHLFAATDSGVYISSDSGATWLARRNGYTSQTVYTLARNSTDVIFAGSDSAVYRSTDNGGTWIRSEIAAGTVVCLAVGSNDYLYAAVNGAAIYRSSDGGVTWTRKNIGIANPTFYSLVIKKENQIDRLFLSTDPAGSGICVLRSDDQGETWKKLNDGLKNTTVYSLASTAAGDMLAGVGGSGIVRLSSTGFSWQMAGLGFGNAKVVAITKGRKGTLFAGTDSLGAWRSTDHGVSWQRSDSGMTSVQILSFAVLSNTNVVAGTSDGLFISNDNGQRWTRGSLQGRSVLSFQVQDSMNLIAGASPGLYRSTDGGTIWGLIGLSGVTIRSIAGSSSSVIVVGSDDGIRKSTDRGNTWTLPSLSTLRVNTLVAATSSLILAGTSGGVYASSDSGASWTQAGFTTEVLSLATNNQGNVFAGTLGQGVFQSASTVYSFDGQWSWMSVGSLHSWYSAMGAEYEEGRVAQQQDGLQWPAIQPYQDMQASKGFWIGTTNFRELTGNLYAKKVVHVGPRVIGTGEFFPVSFRMFSRFASPQVKVNGVLSYDKQIDPHTIDPSMKADRTIVSVVNTALGITVTRKIMQFSREGHDNYIINDYTFTNTGNANYDPEIEFPDQTLTDVFFYWINRYAVCKQTRFTVSNSSGWGINTMNDARGPWYPDPPSNLRAQFSWHGLHSFANLPPPNSSPNASAFDNIGGPIWNPNQSLGFVDPADNSWRLGAAQFIGTVTLHADKSPVDTSDDQSQPSTTNYVASDDPTLTQSNSQYNGTLMAGEYGKMSEGHSARHAWLVDPTGNFSQQRIMGNIYSPLIGDGSSGGFSSAFGYGPYTLKPGQSVHIVYAEAANGLTHEEAVRIGLQYKNGVITTKAKNDSVFLGRERLFDTFRQAIANYNSGFSIPQPLRPPDVFSVVPSGSDRITLSWNPSADENATGFKGYRIYRAQKMREGPCTLIFECGQGTSHTTVEHTFEDLNVVRGEAYFYYVSTFGTIGGEELASSRYYTQTYISTLSPTKVEQLALPQTYSLAQNYPNPFNPSTTIRYGLQSQSRVRLVVYNVLGQVVADLVNTEQAAGWNQVVWNANVSSGLYFYRLEAVSMSDPTKRFVDVKKLLFLR